MKILITKKSIIITPAPKKSKKNGLKVYLHRSETYNAEASDLPIATTDLKKGQRKYSIPKEFVCTIKGIEF